MSWYSLSKFASKINIEVVSGLTVPYRIENQQPELADDSKIKELAIQGIKQEFNTFDPDGFKNMGKRYHFTVADSRDSWEGVTLLVKFQVIGDGEEEAVKTDDPSYDYYKEFHGGKSGVTKYKSPKDAIENIPNENGLAYRGMSWEEWRNIEKTGVIQSKGSYNLGQEGLTFFSYKSSTAESYANSFAPLQYQVTPKTPGVIIAVPQKGLLTSQDRKDIPSTELASLGPLSSEKIVHIWFLIAVSSRNKGDFELRMPWKNVGLGVFEVDPTKTRIGSAHMSAGTSYEIIQKK